MRSYLPVPEWRNWQTRRTSKKEATKYVLGMVFFNFIAPVLTILAMWLFSRLWTWVFR